MSPRPPRSPRPRRNSRQPLVALLVAVGIVVLAYPEVVFLGGSLSPVGLNGVLDRNRPTEVVEVYPNVPDRGTRDGLHDIGARAWQLVPATKLVHRSLSEGESLWWNPYSAAGSLGPETLADMKLSPLVLAIALFGASSTAFTFVVLAFLVLALYCLQQLFVRTLGLGRIAAVAACVVFMFTGFAASEFSSAIGAPYVLFPVVLYTLAEHRRAGGVARFGAAVAAYAGFILTTFVPVQLLVLVLVQVVAIVIDASHTRRGRAETKPRYALRLTGRSLAAPAVALGLTAYAWLPELDALRRAGGDVASYGERTLESSGKLRMLKLASPWVTRTREWVGYVGIAPVLLIAAAWSRAPRAERRLLATTAAMGAAALALHARLPVVRTAGSLPALRAIRGDYWAALAAVAAVLAVGVAVSVIARKGADARAATLTGIVLAALITAAWLVNEILRWHAVPILGVIAAFALIGALVAVARATRRKSRRRVLAIAAVCLLALELFSYQNHERLRRLDVDAPPPRYLTFLREHVGGDRVLAAGRGGLYPEWGAALGIRQIETLNAVQIPAYRRFYREWVNPSEHGLFLQTGDPPGVEFAARPEALDLLSVRYLVVDAAMREYDSSVSARYPLAFDDAAAGVRVYRNDSAFPRAFLSPALAPAADVPVGAWSRATTHTEDTRLLDGARAAGIPPNPPADESPGSARVTRDGTDRIDVEVDADSPAILVLTDSYHPNWEVTVNGRAQHLGRVDDVVRGVVVPRGHSRVVFRYRSKARSLGALVSFATLAALIAGALARAIRKALRARGTASPAGATAQEHAGTDASANATQEAGSGTRTAENAAPPP